MIYFCGCSTQNYALGRFGLWEETRATEGNPNRHEEDLLTPFRRASIAVRRLCKTTGRTSHAAPGRRYCIDGTQQGGSCMDAASQNAEMTPGI